jgi:hypothetical protein
VRKAFLTATRCVALAAVAGFALLCISSIPPSDDMVIKNFQEQRAAFEKLSAMLRVDKEVQYVTTERISMVGATTPLTLPSTSWDDRFREYTSLLKRSNASIAVRSDDRICMTVWKWGAGALGAKLVSVCSVSDGNVPLAGYTKVVDASFEHIDGSWFIERRAY